MRHPQMSGAPEGAPLLVVGSVNADIVIQAPRLPKQGETLKCGGGDVIPGGKGANQAVAAAKMGAPVSFAGVFGGDSHGRMLRDTMHQAGVDTSLSTVSAGPNGQAIIILEPSGANTIVLVPGANNDWDVKLPTGLTEAIEGASCVMLQREIPERINIAVAQHAKKCGVDVLMDVGGDDSPLPKEMLECITMCAPNETELQNLTNMPTSNMDEILLAAKKLQEYGVNKVLVTLGKDGSMVLMESGEVIRQGALPLYDGGRVVDTTGAGDCFRGAFAVALSRQQTIQEGLLLGAAAASLCVQAEGAMPSMPKETEVQAILERAAMK